MKPWLGGVVATLAVALVGCHGNGGDGNGDGGGDMGGGQGVTVQLNIVGEGTVTAGSQSCTDEMSPCTLSGTLGGTLAVSAVPDTGWSFQKFDCDGAVSTSTAIDLAIKSGLTCTVTFTQDAVTLTVATTDGTTAGKGGVVTSSVGNISCGETATPVCSADFAPGTMVTLTAVPQSGHTFTGWSGLCSGTTQATTVTLAASGTCTATFGTQNFALSLAISGGPGTLAASTTASPSLATCTQAGCGPYLVPAGTVVTLTATPASSYEIASWGGACTADKSQSTTTLTMDGTKSCSVVFQKKQHTLGIIVSGSGAVTDGFGKIDSDLGKTSAQFDEGTMVTLTATANTAENAIFNGWGGACSSFNTATTAMVTLDADKSCTASFTVTPHTLTVNRSPTGGGSIVGTRSTTEVINCGSDCEEANIASDQTVQLVATANSKFRFDKWSGCSESTNPTITVTMNNDRTCTANFIPTVVVTFAAQTGGTAMISGAGTCTSSPCTVDSGASVTLSAVPTAGFRFDKWTAGGGGTCSWSNQASQAIAVSGDQNCVANFVVQHLVKVSTKVNGKAIVVSAVLSGTGCAGDNCNVDDGAQIDFSTTAPPANYRFAWVCDNNPGPGWDAKDNSQKVNVNTNADCVATYTETGVLTVTIAPVGSGTVASMDGAIACPATGCTKTYDVGQATTLTASAGSKYTFVNFTGAGCTGTVAGNAITVTIAGATTCTANFQKVQHTLTVNVLSEGETPYGKITGTLTCSGGSCSKQVDEDAAISLTAEPNFAAPDFFDFVEWTGCVNGTDNAINLTMGATNITCNARLHRLWARAFGTTLASKPANERSVDAFAGFKSGNFVIAVTQPAPDKDTPADSYILRLPPGGDLYASTKANIALRYAFDPAKTAGSSALQPTNILRNDDNEGHTIVGNALLSIPSSNFKQDIVYLTSFGSSALDKDLDPSTALYFIWKSANTTTLLPPTGMSLAAAAASPTGKSYGLVGKIEIFDAEKNTTTVLSHAMLTNESGAINASRLFCLAGDCAKGCDTNGSITVTAATVLPDGKVGFAGRFGGQTTGVLVGVYDPKAPAPGLLLRRINEGAFPLVPTGIAATFDSAALIVVGNTAPQGGHRPIAFAVDTTKLELQWQQFLDDGKNDAVVNGLRLNGDTFRPYGDLFDGETREAFFSSFDKSGVLDKIQTYGAGAADSLQSLYVAPNGGILLAGSSTSFGTTEDVWALRVASDGNMGFNDTKTVYGTATWAPSSDSKLSIGATQSCVPKAVSDYDKTYTVTTDTLPLAPHTTLSPSQKTQSGPNKNDN